MTDLEQIFKYIVVTDTETIFVNLQQEDDGAIGLHLIVHPIPGTLWNFPCVNHQH